MLSRKWMEGLREQCVQAELNGMEQRW
jgi:hypothetical protein